MVKLDDSRPRGLGFYPRECLKKVFPVYLMDVMINAPMTCPDLK